MNALTSLRSLSAQELDIVAGGDTVTFYDNDGDGKLSDGDTISHYTMNGIDVSPGLYDALRGSSDTTWSNIGSAIDYASDNPFEMFGFVLDNVDNVAGTPPPDFYYGIEPVYGSDVGP